MVANRRSKLDVIADILRLKGPRTAIMCGANLSYAQIQEYLVVLREAGFLWESPSGKNGRHAHTPTEKGRDLLELLGMIENMQVEQQKVS